MDERLALVIGARVRAARAANHQTQVVVAGLSGITTDYLYQIEHGKKLPTIPVLAQLAQVLHVPLDSLLDELNYRCSSRMSSWPSSATRARASERSVGRCSAVRSICMACCA